jgi:hypothetical protein
MAIFGLKDYEAVDRLIRSGVLEIAAWSQTGRPLFDRMAIVRAGKRILPKPERPSKDQARR